MAETSEASSMPARKGRGTWVWVVAAVLAVLHQDFWWWDSTDAVMGFMPIGLFYHAMYSLAAGVLWFCAVKFAWPHELEVWADEVVPDDDSTEGGRA